MFPEEWHGADDFLRAAKKNAVVAAAAALQSAHTCQVDRASRANGVHSWTSRVEKGTSYCVFSRAAV